MTDGWDLHAVVSSCSSSSSSATVTVAGKTNNAEDPLPDLASLTFTNHDDDNPFHYPGCGDNSNFEFQGLEEIYQSFNFLKPRPNNPISTSSISLTERQTQLTTPQLIKNSRAGSSLTFPAARSRRRKNQQPKLVRQMSHEELLADSWAWRKYGQKPIKGSPYPRNYYRCSTSKGCCARKQVEKSPSDPDVFLVSYSGEHTHPRPTHRNSLAGTTRTKFSSRTTPASGVPSSDQPPPSAVPNPPCSSSSPVSAASSLSPSTPLIDGESINREIIEIVDEDGDEMGEEAECYDEVDIDLIPNPVMSEDILKGFEELRRANSGSTWFQTHENSLSPWSTPRSSTTIATAAARDFSSSTAGSGC